MIQSGSDKAAIAWAIARNIEQSNGLKEKKKAYKEGIVDGKNPEDDITEDWTKDVDDDDIDIKVDEDGNTDGDFIGNMENGLRFDCGENKYDGVADEYYVDIKVDYSVTEENLGDIKMGVLKWDLYGKKSGHVATAYSVSRSNWFVKQYNSDNKLTRWVDKWIINPKSLKLSSDFKDKSGGYYLNNDWTDNDYKNTWKILKDIIYIWRNAKTVSTII